MQKTLIALLIISISFISGCNFPKLNSEETVERCVVSAKFNRCRCHLYEISRSNIGRVSNSINRPLSYCEGAVAFPANEWADIVSWYTEIFEWLFDRGY
jgi:hypothetical protein